MAFVLPVTLPAFDKARDLEQALQSLSTYYSQSNGKVAIGLGQRIGTVFKWHGPNPSSLSPFDAAAKAKETSDWATQRRAYWTNILRPLVADPAFITTCEKTTVRVKDMRISTTQRDEAIQVLKESVAYWDAHFNV